MHYDPATFALQCSQCAARLAIDDDILIVKDQTTANNQVAQQFYDSPLWPKFRFWERFTWVCNGGERRARNKVLRHLPTAAGLDLLDVAIGDGVYLDWLPADWRIDNDDGVGLRATRSRLRECYGDDGHVFEVHSRLDGGTAVIIEIPYTTMPTAGAA